MIVTGTVTGDKEVGLYLRNAPNQIKMALRQAVAEQTIRLQRDIVTKKLQGQVLKVRTGTLQRSIDQVTTEAGDIVTGMSWTNVKYAARHEYGFTGTESVKAHMRKIKQVFGRPIAPKEIQVKGFSRSIKYPARSFMRSALRDAEPQILEALTLATHQGIKH
jgi:phage gpG-like protein